VYGVLYILYTFPFACSRVFVIFAYVTKKAFSHSLSISVSYLLPLPSHMGTAGSRPQGPPGAVQKRTGFHKDVTSKDKVTLDVKRGGSLFEVLVASHWLIDGN
jgi:hypothetical protein